VNRERRAVLSFWKREIIFIKLFLSNYDLSGCLQINFTKPPLCKGK